MLGIELSNVELFEEVVRRHLLPFNFHCEFNLIKVVLAWFDGCNLASSNTSQRRVSTTDTSLSPFGESAMKMSTRLKLSGSISTGNAIFGCGLRNSSPSQSYETIVAYFSKDKLSSHARRLC